MTSSAVRRDFSNPMNHLGDWSSLQVCSFPNTIQESINKIILGAGGFGTGLGQSGHIKTLWAIEWDEPAANTYRSVQYKMALNL
jgi:hypothetical protein